MSELVSVSEPKIKFEYEYKNCLPESDSPPMSYSTCILKTPFCNFNISIYIAMLI